MRHKDSCGLDDSSLEPREKKSRVRECDVCVGKNDCSSQPHACHQFSDDFHHDEDELDEAAEGYHCHPVFRSKSFFASFGFLVIFRLIHGAVRT